MKKEDMKNSIPEIVIPKELDLVEQRDMMLGNGVPLSVLSVEGASVVRLTLVFEGGSSVQHKHFAAASTLSMLSEGSEDFTQRELAERLDYYGIFFDNSTDRDYCFLTIASLRKFLPQALELLQSMLQKPLFSDCEFDLYRAKKREQLLIDRQKPAFQAREAFAKSLFGEEHHYGRFASVDCYDSLTTDDLRRYYKENLHAGNLFAVASGNIEEGELEAIEKFLMSLENRGGRSSVNDKKAAKSSTELFHKIEREEATQSCIRMGRLIFTKQHPDYVPMQLLLMVLGGSFSSRLVQNLRERNGYTYGAYSAMVTLRDEGYIAIATDVVKEASEAAVEEIFAELRLLQEELVSDEELMIAKSAITGELMRLLDGPFGIADIAIENIQSGKSSDYVNEFLQQIQSVDAPKLRELAREYLSPESMLTVVVE